MSSGRGETQQTRKDKEVTIVEKCGEDGWWDTTDGVAPCAATARVSIALLYTVCHLLCEF
jgi:hypothetical protein